MQNAGNSGGPNTLCDDSVDPGAGTRAATVLHCFGLRPRRCVAPESAHLTTLPMASKILYTTVAVVGIAAASGAAWWYQNKPAASGWRGFRGLRTPAGRQCGQALRAAAVEVAQVEIMRLSDDTQAVGSLRSRPGVVFYVRGQRTHHAAQLPRR